MDNKRVHKIISLLTKGMGWTEELAMDRTVDLARINMKGAAEIFREVKMNRQILVLPRTMMEEEARKFMLGRQGTWATYEPTREETRNKGVIQERMKWVRGYRELNMEEEVRTKWELGKKKRKGGGGEGGRKKEREKESQGNRGKKKGRAGGDTKEEKGMQSYRVTQE